MKKIKRKLTVVLATAMAAFIIFSAFTAAADTVRIYGTFNEGPGDLNVIDPVTGLKPENPPYTDPVAPFFPEAEQAPRKDHVTFNPAIMDHNQGWSELMYIVEGNTVQRPQEKVFKRMWYEKEWFKDHDMDGHWDVIIEDENGKYIATVHLDDDKEIHDHLAIGHRIRESNNDPKIGDIYAPAIKQEFAYMALDDIRMPILIQNGSKILIPMAHDPSNPYRGINSFDADNDGKKDAVRIESEQTLGMDIDNDGIEPMDKDGKEVSGDETLVLVLDNKRMSINQTLQFFDNKVTLQAINNLGIPSAEFHVCDNEGGGSTNCAKNQVITKGEVKKYSRGIADSKGPFYIKLIAVSSGTATIEVGRIFDQVRANIGANMFWNQKAFIVDEVFYNVVAIKAHENTFKYIVFRQKLPKDEIKLYGKHLKVWTAGETLPEMPPFNIQHEIMVDVQDTHTKPKSQQDKMGEKINASALNITFIKEDKERRFKGELKEIYNETRRQGIGTPSTFISSKNVLIVNESDIGPPGRATGIINISNYEAGGNFDAGILNMDKTPVSAFSDARGYDTVILFQVNTSNITTAQGNTLVNFVTAGGKLIIWDSDGGPSEGSDNHYDWLPTNLTFHTSVPGPLGGKGGLLKITEENDLSMSSPSSQKFINTSRLTTFTDAVKDANVVTTNGSDWCEDMNATNELKITGPGHMYSRLGGDAGQGFIVYSALDWNAAGEGPGGDDKPEGAELKKMLQFELQVNNMSKLPCIKPIVPGAMKEFWNLEWFHTMPDQFTEFVLPKGQQYLITTGFVAPEAKTHIWDNDSAPIAVKKGDRLKFWFDPLNNTGLYINKISGGEGATAKSSLRLYGSFDEGPGDLKMLDPETKLRPENPPYTDPVAPFFPQAEQAPRKDHITFNPAIMDHNHGWPELIYLINGNTMQTPQEKVFKRMWYEKEWFKDHYKDGANGHWDVVIEDANGNFVTTVQLDDQTMDPQEAESAAKVIHDHLMMGHRIRESNNDPSIGDIYAPAIKQEFTYMALDDIRMPMLIENGSKILIPMAHDPSNPYRGINSFDADNDGQRDAVNIESEQTIGMDIDDDGKIESMDGDGKEVSGDETLVLVLDNKRLGIGNTLQFFDNKVTLAAINDLSQNAEFEICDNEGGGSTNCANNQVITVGEVKKYSRGNADPKGPFYIKLIAVSTSTATIEVGRMFDQVAANIGANKFWNQKAFIVDEVFYNVVAIKAHDNKFKYIVFRQKLPKDEIKLYGKHLKVWTAGETLPEMPPFNMWHDIIVDVQANQTKPKSQQDKIGKNVSAPPLNITFIKEDKERRFKGELKEIYWETYDDLIEHWAVEWFHTHPDQFTEFVLPKGQLYLVTTGFVAPEANTHIWDDAPAPVVVKKGDRLKFWHDPEKTDDVYVNQKEGQVLPPPPPPPPPPTKKCLGNLDNDNEVTFDDFVIFADAYGTHQGDQKYNAKADLNDDNKIDWDDFVIFASVYGTNYGEGACTAP